MGNCMRHQSPTTWAGDDWESPASDEYGVLYDNKSGKTPADAGEKRILASSTEVKIKISKKQLEELLGRVDVQGLSIEQVLAQLMKVSNQYQTQEHRAWRPSLQSIPESVYE